MLTNLYFVLITELLLPHRVRSQLLSAPNLPSLSSYLSSGFCPCKKPPKSTQCLSYDPQYAADTLEEVISNFIDTTATDASKATTMLGTLPAYRQVAKKAPLKAFKCDTEQCLGCFQVLVEKITKSLNDEDSASTNRTKESLRQYMAALGLGKTKNYATHCKILNPVTKAPSYAPMNVSRSNSNVTKEGNKENRPKRQSSPPSEVSSGTSSPIKCDYKRGDRVDSSTNFVGLCNYCWSVRTLPDKYFPRYINERTCDQYDNKCMSGYGSCREIYRSIDVLYNYGTDEVPQWAQYSINTPVSCECQVQAESAMYNFVRQ